MKKIFRFEIIIFGIILISHVYIALSPNKGLMNWFRTDDAFYYFQTARNISNGFGVTFDGINPSNGFHPLWMIVCIPIFSLARIDIYLPFRILIIIIGLLHASSSIILFRWLSKVFSRSIGVVGAIFWAFNPAIHKLTGESGLETGLSAFLVIFLLYRISTNEDIRRKNHRLFGIALIASLAFLARLDNIFLILFLGIWVVFAERKIRNLVVLDCILIFFSAYLSLLLRLGPVFDLYTYSSGIYVFICLTLLIKIPINIVFGLYQPEGLSSKKEVLRNSALSLISSQIIIGAIILPLISLVTWFSFPRSILIIDLFISFILLTLARFIWYQRFHHDSKGYLSPKELFTRNWKTWSRKFLIYYGIIGSTVITYILYNRLAFHTFLPISGQIKQWWGKIRTVYGTNVESIPEALGLSNEPWSFIIDPISNLHNLLSSPLLEILIIILFSIGLVILFLKNTHLVPRYLDSLLLLPILAGSLFQIWTYNLRSYVGFREWYWIAQCLLIFLSFILFFQLFMRIIHNHKIRKILITCSVIFLSLWVGIKYISRIVELTNYSKGIYTEAEYLFGVTYLEEQTEPGSIIGMTGGGTTAYFIHDRTIVNLDGLINSTEYFHALKDHHVVDYLKSIDLQYVFAVPYVINESSPYQTEFPAQLTEIGDYNHYSLYRFGNTDPTIE